jgi:hypothetical protein
MIRGSRIIYVVHHIPGRLRLRIPWLRDHATEGTRLAETLAVLGGIKTVEVRPSTGSVLCHYDPLHLGEREIVTVLKEATGIDIVTRPGEPSPSAEAEVARAALHEGNAIARAAVTFFKEANLDVLKMTEGRVDLGTLVALTFAAAAAVEVVATGKLPVPQWSQLAWWAFRTFTTMEGKAIESVDVRGGGPGRVQAT